MAKRSAKPKRASLVAAEKALAKTLAKSGYTALKNGGQRSSRPSLPQAFESDHSAKYPSADCFGKATPKRELPADAKQFPSVPGHKQGYEYVFSRDMLTQLGKVYSGGD